MAEKLKIDYSDGTSSEYAFNVPSIPGKYKICIPCSDGKVLEAVNFFRYPDIKNRELVLRFNFDDGFSQDVSFTLPPTGNASPSITAICNIHGFTGKIRNTNQWPVKCQINCYDSNNELYSSFDTEISTKGEISIPNKDSSLPIGNIRLEVTFFSPDGYVQVGNTIGTNFVVEDTTDIQAYMTCFLGDRYSSRIPINQISNSSSPTVADFLAYGEANKIEDCSLFNFEEPCRLIGVANTLDIESLINSGTNQEPFNTDFVKPVDNTTVLMSQQTVCFYSLVRSYHETGDNAAISVTLGSNDVQATAEGARYLFVPEDQTCKYKITVIGDNIDIGKETADGNEYFAENSFVYNANELDHMIILLVTSDWSASQNGTLLIEKII